MLIRLERILNEGQKAVAQDLFAKSSFIEGGKSAGTLASKVKRNLEMSDDDANNTALDNLIMGALLRHPVYLNAGLPRKVTAPYYARYTEGMCYGKQSTIRLWG